MSSAGGISVLWSMNRRPLEVLGVLEQPLPLLARVGRAEQRGSHVVVASHRDDLEQVALAQVDHGDAKAGDLHDPLGDGVQGGGEVQARVHALGDGVQRAHRRQVRPLRRRADLLLDHSVVSARVTGVLCRPDG